MKAFRDNIVELTIIRLPLNRIIYPSILINANLTLANIEAIYTLQGLFLMNETIVVS